MERRGERLRLVLASFLMLFVELALIRWTSAYNVYVAYFTNFVLLASFLGIGVGFLRSRGERDLSRWAPAALAVAAALIFVLRVIKGPDTPTDLDTVFNLPAPPIWVVLPLLFAAVVASLATIAEGVGRRFARFEPLDAYRLDIVGSLSGIVAFSALSFLTIGPVLWGLVVVAVFLVLLGRPRDLAAWGWLGAVLLVFGAGSFTPHDTWSPYYRVTVRPVQSDGRIPINVDSLAHQSILPMSQVRAGFYSKPYTHLRPGTLDNVLIVGAGSGNDVALALEMGARHIDAVEIDPVLQRIGAERNPAHPYQNPRVSVHIDDGRAFLERTDSTYNLILFALPDSLTLVSGQSSLRLESYLFTQEAMESVRDHLRPGGAFAMYNYYTPFVFERYANTMDQVFGHEPCFDPIEQTESPRQQAVLTVGLTPGDITCTKLWTPGKDVPAPSTDDHPFPYLRGRAIPGFYLWTLALILIGSVVIVRMASGVPIGAMRGYADLFCMGAAFLLLETKSVVQFALLFGTTWLVNSLVFAGILLAVLLAVEVARRVRLPRAEALYVLLAAALVLAWFVPPDRLLSLAPLPRFFAGVGLAFAPVFLANLIFAQRFRDAGDSIVAFGANLLGAMLGGVLEYLAIMTGYRDLLIVVAVLYGLALLLGRRHLTPEADPREERVSAAAP